MGASALFGEGIESHAVKIGQESLYCNTCTTRLSIACPFILYNHTSHTSPHLTPPPISPPPLIPHLLLASHLTSHLLLLASPTWRRLHAFSSYRNFPRIRQMLQVSKLGKIWEVDFRWSKPSSNSDDGHQQKCPHESRLYILQLSGRKSWEFVDKTKHSIAHRQFSVSEKLQTEYVFGQRRMLEYRPTGMHTQKTLAPFKGEDVYSRKYDKSWRYN